MRQATKEDFFKGNTLIDWHGEELVLTEKLDGDMWNSVFEGSGNNVTVFEGEALFYGVYTDECKTTTSRY